MGRVAWQVLACCVSLNAAAATDAAPVLSAEQVVEKNVAARGGLEAWRRVDTMSWIGHVESGTASGSALPFMLEMKRPNKTRFMINAPQLMSMRAFDGKQGWKLRMTNGSPPDLQPYSAAEVAAALEGRVIDGPLIDYQAKGAQVVLEGVDELEGGKAYRLGVRLPSGAIHRVWIDARSFLEIKGEREFRGALGKPATVTRRYRNYRDVDGLEIPFVIESSVGAGRITDTMVIETVVLNPPLEDDLFGKPHVPDGRQMLMTMGDGLPRMAGPPRGQDWAGLAQQPAPPAGTVAGSGHVR